ncbi:MAG TPA: ferredoxin [Nocardioidaceae bacterium]|nr:ferredoxin [Nocardioidaceae bacterium]
MELRVDRDLCEANAVCTGIAPDVFDLDDEDELQILQPQPPEELRERIQQAVAACPKNALSLT